MALPKDPISLAGAMDPAEVLDFVFDFNELLEAGEEINTFTLTVSAEGAALGLTIQTGGGRAPVAVEDNRAILLWLAVDGAFQGNAAFDGDGTRFGVKAQVVTDALPPRTRERTFALTVRQR